MNLLKMMYRFLLVPTNVKTLFVICGVIFIVLFVFILFLLYDIYDNYFYNMRREL